MIRGKFSIRTVGTPKRPIKVVFESYSLREVIDFCVKNFSIERKIFDAKGRLKTWKGGKAVFFEGAFGVAIAGIFYKGKKLNLLRHNQNKISIHDVYYYLPMVSYHGKERNEIVRRILCPRWWLEENLEGVQSR